MDQHWRNAINRHELMKPEFVASIGIESDENTERTVTFEEAYVTTRWSWEVDVLRYGSDELTLSRNDTHYTIYVHEKAWQLDCAGLLIDATPVVRFVNDGTTSAVHVWCC